MKNKLFVIAGIIASATAGANEPDSITMTTKFYGHNLPTIILAKEINEQNHKFNDETYIEGEIELLNAKLVETESQLSKKNQMVAELTSKIQSGDWTYETYYITGDNTVNDSQKEVLAALFNIALEKNLLLKIEGRADPRGDYDYNLELAKSRAENVEKIAKDVGISDEMITISYSVTETEIQKNRELHFFDRNTSITFSSKT
ncbi:TPA: hypothetical protein I7730_14500 [Vibrio vulnificus]|uniref:OmpA-like domain-containing protein n=1 Tax=Vibrio vulnificus TaxID=672 RepID=A0A8H9TFS1_VIBVL|nr:OmpA family protein [Vibrio vulnificus]HAS8540998.1 hypothetical protein [Vibrio vulnificus]